jgi:predicted TIM-barrel fold metal-dependent hydrolase
MVIIDFHTHVFPTRMRDHRDEYAGRDPLFERLYSNTKFKIADCEDLIAKMDEEGVDRSVILNANWTSPAVCRETNDYIMESVSRYPGRLAGFCSLPPKAIDAAIAELERCIQGGIKGVGEMRPDFHGLAQGDEDTLDPIFDIMMRHRLMLMIHASEPVGHQYVGKEKITPDILERLITRLPDMTIICAHWGGGLPFYALMPEVAEALKNVYFDSSASPYLYKPEIFRHVADIAGADKILFGSDFPLMSPSRVLNQLHSLNLDEDVENMILSGNALRLLS